METEPIFEETPEAIEPVDNTPASAASQLINETITPTEEVPVAEELPITETSLPEEVSVEPTEEMVDTANDVLEGEGDVIEDIVRATFGINEIAIEDSARLGEFEETLYPEADDVAIIDDEAQIIDGDYEYEYYPTGA